MTKRISFLIVLALFAIFLAGCDPVPQPESAAQAKPATPTPKNKKLATPYIDTE